MAALGVGYDIADLGPATLQSGECRVRQSNSCG
jgi:hypothetical protein